MHSRWPLMLAAASVLMVTTGLRQCLGLFVSPIDQATGLGIASISFALAVGQFTWGAVQPAFGALADHHGSGRVLAFGAVLLCAGLVAAGLARSEWALILSLGLVSAAGAGAGSFSILIGAMASRIPAERRSFAAGFVNAGASVGQALFAPLAQALIAGIGWSWALMTLGLAALGTLPMAAWLHNPPQDSVGKSAAVTPAGSFGAQLRAAAHDRSYLCLHLSFFTCGVHIAFLATHLPGEVALCGLPARVSATALALIGLFNIGGSLMAGALGTRVRMRNILAAMYASRAVIIGVYLLSPRTPLTFYLFAAALGLSWLATVPPTAGIVGKLFGTRYLATLFGLTLLSHQTGAFLGAWLGGVTRSRFGDYGWMWYADMVLALLAALACLPIREAAPARAVMAPA